MFERNKIDNASRQVQAVMVPVEVTLSGEAPLAGKVAVPGNKSLAEHLNSAAPFIELEPIGSEPVWIAKSALRQVKIVSVAEAPSLPKVAADTFDPYAELKVTRTASFDEVRAAYLKATKVYHPDRFTGVELPPEVAAYVETAQRRLNAAYALIERSFEAQKRAEEQRSRPVYTSRPVA